MSVAGWPTSNFLYANFFQFLEIKSNSKVYDTPWRYFNFNEKIVITG